MFTKVAGQKAETDAGDSDTVFPTGVHVPERNPQDSGSNRKHFPGLGQTDCPAKADRRC